MAQTFPKIEIIQLTKSQHQEELNSLQQEWGCWSALWHEATDLWNNLDFREGIALLDNNQKHIEQCKKLKEMCRKREQRRSYRCGDIYEEMDWHRTQLNWKLYKKG